MQYTFFALATAGVLASAQSVAPSASPVGGLIPLGENCTPGGTPCANGAQCYASNYMLQPRCGNTQSSCTSNLQCAFTTCNGGICNGYIWPSSSSVPAASPTITSSSTAPGWQPAPSPTIVAPAGSLPLGAECNPFVTPSQCVQGVQCWASNAGLIARCGNFNANCQTDAQCAYNTCNNGLCNGLPKSSGLPVSSSSSSSTVPGTLSVQPSAGPTANGTVYPSRGPTPTSSGTPLFTGAASAEKVAGGVFAIVVGAAAALAL